MISQRARYAFKAIAALARAEPGRGLQIRQLCEQEKLPRKFIEQILLTLKAGGYISSRRGRDGGYELLRPIEQIHVGPLLRLLEGPLAPLTCLSRTAYRRCADCKDEAICELHLAFAQPYADYLAALERKSLAEILRESDTNAGQAAPGTTN